jgi:hypothetical protein
MKRAVGVVRAGSSWVVATAALLSCAPSVDDGSGQAVSEVAVGTLRGQPGCSTAGAEGLSAQLLDELLCLAGGGLVSYAGAPGITLTNPRVHPVLSPAARDGLVRAAATTPLRINSGFRTLVEQWLLYTAAGCGLVAVPGSSNHETGRAVDVDNHATARAALVANGFAQSYPSNDPVHFDGPGSDFRAMSVRAFQRLWNANNPTDRIAEDGAWGPMTQSRLERSPAEGFRIGRVCGMPTTTDPRLRAQFVSQSFATAATAIEMTPGQELAGFIELRNTGTQTWIAGTTMLATTQPRDGASPLAHPTWIANNRPATVSASTAMGASARFAFTIRAPMTPGDYSQYFGLIHTGIGWFSDPGQGGPPDNQLQIRVRVGGAPFAAEVLRNTCSTAAVIAPGATRACELELRNTGTQSWTMGRTFLATANARDHESPIADLTWTSPARVASVSRTVARGESYTFAFDVHAPLSGGDFTEYLNLVDEVGGWFSDMANGGPTDESIVLRLSAGGDGGTTNQDASTDDSAIATRDAGSGGVDVQPVMGGCGCRVNVGGDSARASAWRWAVAACVAGATIRSARRAGRPRR